MSSTDFSEHCSHCFVPTCWLVCYSCLLQLLVSTVHIVFTKTVLTCLLQKKHCSHCTNTVEGEKGVHCAYCLAIIQQFRHFVSSPRLQTRPIEGSKAVAEQVAKNTGQNYMKQKQHIGVKLFHNKLWSGAILNVTNFNQKCTVQSNRHRCIIISAWASALFWSWVQSYSP